jgi:2-keto-4-pentenoate hydratase/2-oxohepta-3-ene-1,7-dioic acid hydratase in catechol pathway
MPVFGRFRWNGVVRYAEIENEVAYAIESPFDWMQGAVKRTGEQAPLSELEILAPVEPPKLFAIGLNYADHAAESGKAVPDVPLMWFKSTAAIIAHGQTVEVAYPEHRTDYEAELTVVIGKTCRNVTEENALDYVLGYTCGQDISDRNIQRSESQWARAKSLDTYAPLGPFIHTDVDPANVEVQTWLNGELKQSGHTRDMIFPVRRLIAFLSEGITLQPGDCIMTGTPEGIGAIGEGDVIETRIGSLTPLRNPVRIRSTG